MTKRNLPAIALILLLAALACNLPRQIPPTATDVPVVVTAKSAFETAVNATPTNTIPATKSPVPETVTVTTTPAPTMPVSTAAPVPEGGFPDDLERRGYLNLASSSTIGPGELIYSAYLFSNERRDTETGETTREICRLAFTRLSGAENELLRYFTAPPYVEQSRYQFPVSCEAIHWEAPSPNVTWGGEIPADTRQALEMSGHWSDINQNGLPEFGVYYQYCGDGCLDYGAVATHFYELRNTFKVENITAALPGVLHPWDMVVSSDPLILRVHDPIEYEPQVLIDTSWLYTWRDGQFVDVTHQHADEYRTEIDEIVAEIKKEYGMAISHTRTDFLEILLLANKARLPQGETLDTFLDVTNPAHWPGSSTTMTCWLQLGRAYARQDAQKERPFRLPPNETTLNGPKLEDIVEDTGIERYDLTACQQLLNR